MHVQVIRVNSLTSPDGAIRLPIEDGTPADIFNEDEHVDAGDALLAARQPLGKSQTQSNQTPRASRS